MQAQEALAESLNSGVPPISSVARREPPFEGQTAIRRTWGGM